MNWFKKLFKSNRNEEEIDRLRNDFIAFENEIKEELDRFPETYASIKYVGDVYNEYRNNSEISINSTRERFDNMLESTVESLVLRLKSLENLAKTESTLDQSVEDLKKLVDKHSKQIKRVEDRIGKNELMHVETDKTLNESFQSAMKSVTREASQFKKFAVRLAIDLAYEKIKEIEKQYKSVAGPDPDDLHIHFGPTGNLGYESTTGVESEDIPTFTIFVNGEEKKTEQSVLNFEEIVELAFPGESKDTGIDLSASYEVYHNIGLKMFPDGGVIDVVDGMMFVVEPK
jgi:hypothetical protein